MKDLKVIISKVNLETISLNKEINLIQFNNVFTVSLNNKKATIEVIQAIYLDTLEKDLLVDYDEITFLDIFTEEEKELIYNFDFKEDDLEKSLDNIIKNELGILKTKATII